MSHKNRKTLSFYCFSPMVMLSTFIIELSLAMYALYRYRSSLILKLSVAILLCLAGFQLAEYNVCLDTGLFGLDWSRFGYVCITLLPPLGLHAVHALAGKTRSSLPTLGYAVSSVWMFYFVLTPDVFINTECTGNYVIFQFNQAASYLYGFYYYSYLLVTLGLAYRWIKGSKAKIARTLRGFIIGYLLFILPTALAGALNPATRAGIPSVMCGFAMLFALVLTLYVLPRHAKTK